VSTQSQSALFLPIRPHAALKSFDICPYALPQSFTMIFAKASLQSSSWKLEIIVKSAKIQSFTMIFAKTSQLWEKSNVCGIDQPTTTYIRRPCDFCWSSKFFPALITPNDKFTGFWQNVITNHLSRWDTRQVTDMYTRSKLAISSMLEHIASVDLHGIERIFIIRNAANNYSSNLLETGLELF